VPGSRTYNQTKGKKAWIQEPTKEPVVFTEASDILVSKYVDTKAKKQSRLANTLKKMANRRKKKQ
tara:strand:- start:468 stop:662 length:195 start_codon:yes stop_codon:yes gene_type:complete